MLDLIRGRKILDHGYVQLIETWGGDESIIEAARMSTNKGFKGWGERVCESCDGLGKKTIIERELADPRDELVFPQKKEIVCPECKGNHFVSGDEKLLAYLYNHKHMTPFEMAGMIIEVKAPIFVFREWHRHRTQSYNEMSARYTPLPDENYFPTPERCLVVNSMNKQANKVEGAAELTHNDAIMWLTQLEYTYRHAQKTYELGLELGIPKELARFPVPVARYSRMRASANLRNWLAFLTLRMDTAAQWEIREYANAVAEIIEEIFPRTYELFMKGMKDGH